MRGEPTVIYSAANTQQAHLLKGLLEQQGIAASVVNDAIQMAGGELPLGWTSAARVVVAEENAAAARTLAEEFDQHITHESSNDDLTEPEPLAVWSDWPLCPQCNQRRSARCPVCGASRTDFLLADLQDLGDQAPGDPAHVLLKCDDCDDLIRPEWYRLCAACGYDYGTGIEIGEANEADAATNKNEWLVVAALLTGALVLAAYFAWLFTARHA